MREEFVKGGDASSGAAGAPSVEGPGVPALLGAGVKGFRSGAWSLISWDEQERWSNRGRRFVFGTMRYRDQTGETPTMEVVVKTYRRDPGTRSLGALERLWDHGFRAPSFYRVSRPLGRVPGRNVLIQERARGTPWGRAVEMPPSEETGLSAGAADWLVRLQSVPLDDVAPEERGDPAPTLPPRHPSRLAEELLRRYHGRAPRLEPAVGRLLGRLPEAHGQVVSHGDYHPNNVFVSPWAVTAIDFDNFGLREAAYDVGYAIGQLLIMSHMRTGSFLAGARAAADFWGSYEKEGRATPDRIGAHVSRTFLQSLHYELITLNNGRTDLIEPWTRQMERWLLSEGPETLEDLIRHS